MIIAPIAPTLWGFLLIVWDDMIFHGCFGLTS